MLKLEDLKNGDKFYIFDKNYMCLEHTIIECEVVQKYAKSRKYILVNALTHVYPEPAEPVKFENDEPFSDKLYKEAEEDMFSFDDLEEAIKHRNESEELLRDLLDEISTNGLEYNEKYYSMNDYYWFSNNGDYYLSYEDEYLTNPENIEKITKDKIIDAIIYKKYLIIIFKTDKENIIYFLLKDNLIDDKRTIRKLTENISDWELDDELIMESIDKIIQCKCGWSGNSYQRKIIYEKHYDEDLEEYSIEKRLCPNCERTIIVEDDVLLQNYFDELEDVMSNEHR